MKKIIAFAMLFLSSIAFSQTTVVETTNLNTNNNTNLNITQSSTTTTTDNTNTNTNINQTTSNVVTNATNNNINETTSNSNSVSDSNQTIEQKVNSPPPSAIAPTMMSYSQDVCTSGLSGAVQTQVFGVSGGKALRDENCERMKLSKTLYDMGMKVAAVSLLCQDDRVFDAMKMAGTPCPFEGKIGAEATAKWQETAAEPEKKRKFGLSSIKKIDLNPFK